MLTPAKYWRIACNLDQVDFEPASAFQLPYDLVAHKSAPAKGHGITIAAYDEPSQTGMLRWIGIITSTSGSICHVTWKLTTAEIWIDTGTGRGRWKAGSFAFAPQKISDYGLHELWNSHFPELQLRSRARMCDTPKVNPKKQVNSVNPQRLNPMEVIGEPFHNAKAGVVYILKSAYGYKVGRTRNVPDRMRAFGVKLPFIYTIPLVAWFEDCHEAESKYHQCFASKRINGEWFDLDAEDIELIRLRA